MTRDIFFSELKKHLKGCSKEEMDEIIEDYNEYFNDAIDAGRNEEEVCAALGSPKLLARQLIAESAIKIAEDSYSIDNILKATLAIVGLGFFNLVFILGPLVGVISVVFSLALVAIILLILGVISPLGLFMLESYAAFDLLIYFLSAIGIFAAGTALGSFTILLSRLIYRALVKYLKLNLKIVKGGK